MALTYSNVKVELREISLKNRPKELYDISKKGTVPVLITTDNKIIDESIDIMLWSLKNNPKQTWLSDNHMNEIKIINRNDLEFKKWLDRYKYYDRYPENTKIFYRDKCNEFLFKYNKQLNGTKYLLRDDICISDIAIFPFVRQFANVDYPWFESNYDKLVNWFEKISSSNIFRLSMKKYDLWNYKAKKLIVDFNEV